MKLRLLETGAADNKTAFIANHFSHNGGLDHDAMAAEAARVGFVAAYDGMTAGV